MNCLSSSITCASPVFHHLHGSLAPLHCGRCRSRHLQSGCGNPLLLQPLGKRLSRQDPAAARCVTNTVLLCTCSHLWCSNATRIVPLTEFAIREPSCPIVLRYAGCRCGRSEEVSMCSVSLSSSSGAWLWQVMGAGAQRTQAWHDLRDCRLTASAFANAIG